MSNPDRPEFQRQRYWQGQTLRSRDLNDQLAVEDEMRWWHNRALHQTYGVMNGFEVSEVGNDRLCVSPGLAYDCYGRELRLQSPTLVAAREPAGETWTLLIQYRDRPRTCERLGSLRSEGPELIWKPSRRINLKDGVPIKETTASALQTSEDTFQIPNSRPLARPLIGRGSTVAGKTDWRLWSLRTPGGSEESGSIRSPIYGIEVTIDTSAAGFTDTPCYFAWLHGGLFSRPRTPPPAEVTQPGNETVFFARLDRGFPPFVIDRITEVEPTRFVFSLWNVFQQRDLLSFARRSLYVCWLGLQMQETKQDF